MCLNNVFINVMVGIMVYKSVQYEADGLRCTTIQSLGYSEVAGAKRLNLKYIIYVAPLKIIKI